MFRVLLLLLSLNQCRLCQSDSVTDGSMPNGPCKRKLLSVTKNPGMIGATIPQCDDKTGNYKVRQCSGSVGSCWCVDEKTGENVGESLDMDENGLPVCEPNCFRELREIPFFLVHGEPVIFPGSYVPQCDVKTGYFLPKQCLQDKKQCWCVSRLGKEIDGTRTTDSTLECKS